MAQAISSSSPAGNAFPTAGGSTPTAASNAQPLTWEDPAASGASTRGIGDDFSTQPPQLGQGPKDGKDLMNLLEPLLSGGGAPTSGGGAPAAGGGAPAGGGQPSSGGSESDLEKLLKELLQLAKQGQQGQQQGGCCGGQGHPMSPAPMNSPISA